MSRIDDEFDAFNAARRRIGALDDIADALQLLGIPAGLRMAATLEGLHADLTRMHEVYNSELQASFEQSREATHNVIHAAMAGIRIGTPK